MGDEALAAEETRPRTIIEYRKWLEEVHGTPAGLAASTHYSSVASKLKQDLEESSLWSELREVIREWNDEYLLATQYPLTAPFDLTVRTKPFKSFLDKTHRKNVLENSEWPEPPDGGWILPPSWFSEIRDVVRTLLVVKYLDGANFLVRRLESFFTARDVTHIVQYEAKEEGYYAIHVYAQMEFEIPKLNWDTERRLFWVEFQVTTQLQEVIRSLTHTYYEQRRSAPPPSSEKWQWNFRSDEFFANYLGHILHYVEGMIVEIRERQGSDRGGQ
jgi:ppGpp synthetase/RelA/SpoT-type nucleotidyltranferase